MADGDALIIGVTNEASTGSGTVLNLAYGPTGAAGGFLVHFPDPSHGSSNAAALSGLNASGDGVAGTSQDFGTGVRGYSQGGYGLSGTGGNIGVFAGNWHNSFQVYLGTSVLAADIYGPVRINGKLSSPGGGGFLIDHPQDPSNRYLAHNSIESSERKNLYDGVVDLDSMGAATVEMPGWFEALNSDFRYQLTAIGGPAPGLHIAEELSNRSFKIAGGTPNGRVSWHVTGVRRDPWAVANTSPTEEEKPDNERGTYLHPELYDESSEHSLRTSRYPVSAISDPRRQEKPSV
jgi:hypothetical protein